VRNNAFAKQLDRTRWGGGALGVSPLPAAELFRSGSAPVPNADVAAKYGVLAHYVTWDMMLQYSRAGALGGTHGCWLTPTPYSACLVPYALGLFGPKEFCLLVRIDDPVVQLWGPGTAPPGRHPSVWRGGGIEFYSAVSIPLSLVTEVVPIETCGDS
jgi:hypothetical protein